VDRQLLEFFFHAEMNALRAVSDGRRAPNLARRVNTAGSRPADRVILPVMMEIFPLARDSGRLQRT
jgi:hypothetical protein